MRLSRNALYREGMNASSCVVANVRGLMGETGVTQSQVGEWLGLSQAAVAKRISTRAVVFNVDELEAIAEQYSDLKPVTVIPLPWVA